MYSGGFYPFDSLEEHWAYWSRYIYINRYLDAPKPVYQELLKLVQGKDYFVLTTNVDHCFQKAGFDKQRLFYTQGDYGLWQCPRPCHQKTYDNEAIVKKMVAEQKDRKIPSELIPRCPVCGAPMSMNLRADDTFVEDEGWHIAARQYEEYLQSHEGQQILFLELGVGGNTPVIIKYPFWRMTLAIPGCLCLYQSGSGILPAGNRIPVSLHRKGHRRSPDRAFVKNVLPAAGERCHVLYFLLAANPGPFVLAGQESQLSLYPPAPADPKCFRYLCTEPEAAFSIRSRTPFSCCSAILIPVSIPADT